MEKTYCSSTPVTQDKIKNCKFCGSDRSKNELIAEVPLRVKFGIFLLRNMVFAELFSHVAVNVIPDYFVS